MNSAFAIRVITGTMKKTILLFAIACGLTGGVALADPKDKDKGAGADAKDKDKDKGAGADAKDKDKGPAPKEKEAPPAEAANASAEIKAGTGVENHEIVGEASKFPKDTTVWLWSRINNGPSEIKHIWKKGGEVLWTATLPIKSTRWSTMSRRAMGTPGEYEVEVTTADGASLGTVKFTIE